MQKQKRPKEGGYIEVEATIILPLAVLSVIMLLFLSLFLYQRASLQAGLETTLVYYKNIVTDTYLTRNDALIYAEDGGNRIGAGNSYEAIRPLNPYRGLFNIIADNISGENAIGGFEEYFYSVAGGQLFADDLKIEIKYTNYALIKEFKATAVQTVTWPIDLSLIGVGKEYEISAAARVVVADHDEIIRDADFAIDLLENTKLGEIAHTLADSVSAAYAKMKEVLQFGG